ncbi:MAG: hypothetical protein GYB36_10600 [Alphaproteobacteria bacterium]|nr:hypothetical protein [Alphaproteobacteria bacterium]
MSVLRVFLASACLAFGPAAFAVELPEVIEQIVSTGPQSDAREHWRFRITVEMDDSVFVGRFDGSSPEGEQWELVSPSLDQMSEDQSEIWSELIEPVSGEDEGGLFLMRSDLDYTPGSFNLIEESASQARFSFTPELGEDEAAFAEFVTGEMIVDTQAENLEQVRIFAVESFKPNVAIRINEFEVIQEFDRIEGLPAPVMTRMSQSVTGSMAFRQFSQQVDIRFDEIERLAR